MSDRRQARAALLLGLLLVISLTAFARDRAAAEGVEERIAEFWRRVDAMAPTDHLPAADLGQWALNVIGRDPTAGIFVKDFRASTADMQKAFEAAATGLPPGAPAAPAVEERIARFWARVEALGPDDALTAADVGQWAINVTERDRQARIRVDAFRISTAAMQSAFDRARSGPRPTLTPAPSAIVWTKAGGFPVSGVVWAIAVEPENPRRLYVSIENLGLLVTSDGGLTWDRHDPGHHFQRGLLLEEAATPTLYYLYGGGIVSYDRRGPQQLRTLELEGGGYSKGNRVETMVTLRSGIHFAASPAGVFRIAGGSVQKVSTGLPDRTIVSTLATSADKSTIYAGTRGPWYYDTLFPGQSLPDHTPRGLFKSTDEGASWVAIGGTSLNSVHINSIVVDPRSAGRMYVGTSDGVYGSDDGGTSWTARSDGLTNRAVWVLAADPTDPDRIFAGTWGGGLLVTTNGGASWTRTSLSGIDFHLDRVFSLAFDPIGARTLFVGTGDGLFRYSLATGTHSRIAGTLFASSASDLAVAPDDPSRVYVLEGGAGGGRDLYRSRDRGGSWEFIGPFRPLQATRGACRFGLECAGYSIDHTYGMQVRVHPTDPNTVLYSSAFGIFVSRDAGSTWSLVRTGVVDDQFHIHGVAFAPSDPNVIYLTTGGPCCDNNFIFTHAIKSTDGGTTWTLVDNGLPRANYHMQQVIVDPRDANIVYTAGNTTEFGCVHKPVPPCIAVGIYKTTDGGRTWSAANSGLEDLDVLSLVLDPTRPDRLYAGAGNAVYVTTNGGRSWTKALTLAAGTKVTAVTTGSRISGLVVAGASPGGVYVSSDAGATWAKANDGFGSGNSFPRIDALVFSENDTAIYAAAGGVYRGTYRPVR